MKRWVESLGARFAVTLSVLLGVAVGGCAPTYQDLRMEGHAALERKDYGVAKRLLKRAEHIKPQDWRNLYDIGVCCLLAGDEKLQQRERVAAKRELDEAYDYFQRVAQARPGDEFAYRGMNVSLELKGEYEKALSEAEWAAQNVGPSVRLRVYLAQELEQRGDMDAALATFREAIDLDPNNSSAHYAFAQFLYRRGQDAEAMYELEWANRLAPEDEQISAEVLARGGTPVAIE